ncbi:hypothetical protein BC828DRAFT_407119 [Blastocladiella britannica]|nr:hypothetical protein BC828DRAFT_407119 [Blastocladiella britannica]
MHMDLPVVLMDMSMRCSNLASEFFQVLTFMMIDCAVNAHQNVDSVTNVHKFCMPRFEKNGKNTNQDGEGDLPVAVPLTPNIFSLKHAFSKIEDQLGHGEPDQDRQGVRHGVLDRRTQPHDTDHIVGD